MLNPQVGPYRIVGELGRGAYGAVFEAVDADGRPAAVKVLHASRLLEPEVQNRFVREIALLQRLDHPNIVAHYDCGLHEDSIYCAMELVQCGALKDVLNAQGALGWREAAEVVREVALGLDHAHRHGCVHRDLKPANLYLSADGRVKIGDLGLARDLGAARLTADGKTLGTWRYMAPEQITGAAEIDGRLDLYALGCILFEMLVGRPPFEGLNFAEIFDQHLETPAPRIDALGVRLPPPLADLAEQLLAKRRDDRPRSAREVVERIDALLEAPTTASGDSPHPPDKTPAATSSADSGGAPRAAPPNLTQRLRATPDVAQSPSRGRVVAILAALAVLALVLASVLAG
jgi:serine/threonine protein kinase